MEKHNLIELQYALNSAAIYSSGIQSFFVRVPPDIISLELCTPKVVGV
jgi:hypothetical protein